MSAGKGDVEAFHGIMTHIVEADAEFAGLVVVGSMVTVAFLIVDFDVVKNEVRPSCRNRVDEMLVTVIVLLGDSEFDHGASFLRNDINVLRVACGIAKADDLSVGAQADGGAFVGFYGVLFAAGSDDGQHFNAERLRHFCVKGHISIAMLMEQVIGNLLPVFIGP